MKSPKESFKSLKDTFTLSNGVQIPCVGFGTYLTPDGETGSLGSQVDLNGPFSAGEDVVLNAALPGKPHRQAP